MAEVTSALPPAVAAFDAIASDYDRRFGGWASVAAQRRAVRRELLSLFRPEARLLELGGGTGAITGSDLRDLQEYLRSNLR